MRDIQLRRLSNRPAIHLFFAVLVSYSGTSFSKETVTKRCGWIDNPTPRNWWLSDQQGKWIISSQGGHMAEGEIPDFKKNWVKTNGSHGYGCGCLSVIEDTVGNKIVKILKTQVLPIKKCKSDKNLPRR